MTDKESLSFKFSPDGYRFTVRSIGYSPDLNNPSELYELMDHVESIPGEPLMRIQLTNSPSQSYLAVSISHAAADGYSYFLFLTLWARKMRGEEIFPPTHNRQALIPQPDSLPKVVTPEDLFQRAGVVWSHPRNRLKKEELRWE